MHSFSPDSLCLQALLWPKGEKVPRRAHVRLPTGFRFQGLGFRVQGSGFRV